MALLAGILATAALVFSWGYFDTAGTLFHSLTLIFLGGMCGFSLSGDLFNLFVFFELMSVAAFALCGYKSEEPGPLQGALNFAVTNTIGAVLALTGIALLYGRTGSLNMAQIGRALEGRGDGLVVTAFVFLGSGFLIKAAVVPFHFWLPDAHAVAPTPVCVLFSGIMVELGLYGFARVYWAVFSGALEPHANALRHILVAAGVLTALLGAVMCFAQRHLKRLLAFSTVAHMGLVLLGVGLLDRGALGGAGVYVMGHALVKSALFLCAGIILHRLGSVDELELRGRGKIFYAVPVVYLFAALELAGLPLFGSFLGEAMIAQETEQLGYS
jgi:multicomponent Na+:H+ antiporter subunit D